MIGQAIAPEAGKPSDAAGADALACETDALAGADQLFRQGARPAGEQMPVYAISFELYENGISRGLSLDYNDFVIAGEMTALEMKKSSPCR